MPNDVNALQSYKLIDGSLLDIDYIFDTLIKKGVTDIQIYARYYLVSCDFKYFKRICRMFGYETTYTYFLEHDYLSLKLSVLKQRGVKNEELGKAIENFALTDEDISSMSASGQIFDVNLSNYLTLSIVERLLREGDDVFLPTMGSGKVELLEKVFEYDKDSLDRIEYYSLSSSFSEEIQEFLIRNIPNSNDYLLNSYLYNHEVFLENIGVVNCDILNNILSFPLDVIRLYLSKNENEHMFERIICYCCLYSRKEVIRWLFSYYPTLSNKLDWNYILNRIVKLNISIYLTSLLISCYLSNRENTLESWIDMVQIQETKRSYHYDDFC